VGFSKKSLSEKQFKTFLQNVSEKKERVLREVKKWKKKDSVAVRCSRQHAPIAARSARFPSNRPRVDLFIVGIASRSTEMREEARHDATKISPKKSG
jgi:Cys-tRNA synthase (O-phospho-L-seryl-tRNA:Cys-tRNA synthase)